MWLVGNVAAQDREAKAVSTALAVAEVPEAPRLALQRAAQNHPIPLVIRRDLGGRSTYETTVVLGNTPLFIKVAADGQVLERGPGQSKPSPQPKTRRPTAKPRPIS